MPAGRPISKNIKHIEYEHFYIIMFRCYDYCWGLCKTNEGRTTFKILPLEKDYEIIKFYDEEEAKKVLLELPDFEIGGWDASVKVIRRDLMGGLV